MSRLSFSLVTYLQREATTSSHSRTQPLNERHKTLATSQLVKAKLGKTIKLSAKKTGGQAF